jgi:hypothetical protein
MLPRALLLLGFRHLVVTFGGRSPGNNFENFARLLDKLGRQ